MIWGAVEMLIGWNLFEGSWAGNRCRILGNIYEFCL